MTKFKSILVPIDFSEFSDRAVDYALYLAERHGARITLLHAVVLHQQEIGEELYVEEYEKIVLAKEEHSRKKFQLHGQKASRRGISLDSQVVRGISAADAILDFINDNGHDLVVMGTHGRTGVKKWLYGSVAEKVVRLSPVPVLTIHQSWKKFAIQKILVPVDFSEYSKKALDVALPLAKQFNAQLVFLHVIEQEVHPAYYAGGYESLFIIDPQLREKSIHNLKDFVGKPIKNAQYLVTEGRAFKEIVEFADENECDLILLATRGLTGLEHLLIGSTTERVVRLAKCPVLTVERDG
jgi:nucleotide-binding universal stress UspA family protein